MRDNRHIIPRTPMIEMLCLDGSDHSFELFIRRGIQPGAHAAILGMVSDASVRRFSVDGCDWIAPGHDRVLPRTLRNRHIELFFRGDVEAHP